MTKLKGIAARNPNRFRGDIVVALNGFMSEGVIASYEMSPRDRKGYDVEWIRIRPGDGREPEQALAIVREQISATVHFDKFGGTIELAPL